MPTEILNKNKTKKGLKIDPRFCKSPTDPFSTIEWDSKNSVISNPDGSIVFKAENIRVPKSWSLVATDILAQKYFRRAGVPVALVKVNEAIELQINSGHKTAHNDKAASSDKAKHEDTKTKPETVAAKDEHAATAHTAGPVTDLLFDNLVVQK